MRTAFSTSFVLATLVLSQTCAAFDFITGRGIGLGQTMLLSKPTAATVLCVPSAGLSDGTAFFDFGANRKFDLKEFDQNYFTAAYRHKAFTSALGFTQFGHNNLYAERTAKLSVALNHRDLVFHGSLSAMQVDFGGHYESLSAISLGFGFGYRRDRVLTGLSVEHVNFPQLTAHARRIPPRASLYAELIGPGPYSITGRITAQKNEKPQFGLGQFIDISSFGSLFWGISTAPLIYGGGVELSHKRIIITYATSYHPTLGLSHTLSLSFTVGAQNPE